MHTNNHQLFAPNFIDDIKLKQWEAFLEKVVLPKNLSLEEVLDLIKERLKPIWDKM